ncbi:MAG: germination protein YpeB [Caldicoprobacter oshimai]|uniref:Germination protein YpeB n=1 Tax=Caldicoprobacter faecalis TaxID=937334 RepID=A0A1I5VYB3_9FIRM|nr:germination protein YpeB [Caldicoprobacter faecalis]PZN11965.1 MAG: germination protein YpeB [Caldicoprobacter oshimai]SFQ12420.1 germination protein YpeB [Caldicoprobacter faecalis]
MTRWILTIVLAVALIVVGLWGYNQYLQNLEYRNYMENLYQKSFFELVGQIGDIETKLSKLMVSGDQGQSMMLLSDVWRQADAAQVNLGQLPLGHLSLIKTSKFINQLADYCYYLTKKVGRDQTISVEEMNNLQKLHNSCARLNDELKVLVDNINSGGVKWGEIRQAKVKQELNEDAENLIERQFMRIERTGIDYPTLIYDGPFSETLQQKRDIRIQGQAIDQKKAEEIAADFVGRDRVAEINNGPQTTADIETWGVYIKPKNGNGTIFLSVSKRGGKVVNMISDGEIKSARISVEEARRSAERFLSQKGYRSMVPTYSQKFDGTLVINFAYKQGDVIVYPDLIKVKVSLEDGSIVGFDARNYLIAHKERDIKPPRLSLDEARKLVNPNLKIKSEGLAIIPTESGGEKLCYEFRGEYGGDNFIVYIDANNGKEVNILKIIDTANGTLAI